MGNVKLWKIIRRTHRSFRERVPSAALAVWARLAQKFGSSVVSAGSDFEFDPKCGTSECQGVILVLYSRFRAVSDGSELVEDRESGLSTPAS
jgi:hypothetical protein